MLQKKFETHAERAFPNASDELIHIFVLSVPDDKQDQLLKELRAMAAIEYAEAEPIRQLF